MPPCRGEEEDGDSGRMESGEGWRRRRRGAAEGGRGESGAAVGGTGALAAAVAARGQAGGPPASGPRRRLRGEAGGVVGRSVGGEGFVQRGGSGPRGRPRDSGCGGCRRRGAVRGGGARPGLGAARGRCRRWRRRAALGRASAVGGSGLCREEPAEPGGSFAGGRRCPVGAGRGRAGGARVPPVGSRGVGVSRVAERAERGGAPRGELCDRGSFALGAVSGKELMVFFDDCRRAAKGHRGCWVARGAPGGACWSSVSLLIDIVCIFTFFFFFDVSLMLIHSIYCICVYLLEE